MLHQCRLYITEIAEDSDSGKHTSLQDQQQQIAHVCRSGSSKYAGTFTVQQKILYQLQQKLTATGQDIRRQKKATQENGGNAVIHSRRIRNRNSFRTCRHPGYQQIHHIAANLRMEASHKGVVCINSTASCGVRATCQIAPCC